MPFAREFKQKISSINNNCFLIHTHPPKKQRFPTTDKKKTQKERKKEEKKQPPPLPSIGSEGKSFNSLEKTASFTLHHLKATIQDIPFHVPARASFIAASPQKDTNSIDFYLSFLAYVSTIVCVTI